MLRRPILRSPGVGLFVRSAPGPLLAVMGAGERHDEHGEEVPRNNHTLSAAAGGTEDGGVARTVVIATHDPFVIERSGQVLSL